MRRGIIPTGYIQETETNENNRSNPEVKFHQIQWVLFYYFIIISKKRPLVWNQRLSIHRYSPWVSAYGFVRAHVLNLNG